MNEAPEIGTHYHTLTVARSDMEGVLGMLMHDVVSITPHPVLADHFEITQAAACKVSLWDRSNWLRPTGMIADALRRRINHSLIERWNSGEFEPRREFHTVGDAKLHRRHQKGFLCEELRGLPDDDLVSVLSVEVFDAHASCAEPCELTLVSQEGSVEITDPPTSQQVQIPAAS